MNQVKAGQKTGANFGIEMTPAQFGELNTQLDTLLRQRNRPPGELLRGLQTTGEQRQRVEALGREAGKYRQEVQKAQQQAGSAMMGADLGPESPQRMTMMVMYRGAQQKMQSHFREFGREVVLEILTPSQLAAYVVGSGAP